MDGERGQEREEDGTPFYLNRHINKIKEREMKGRRCQTASKRGAHIKRIDTQETAKFTSLRYGDATGRTQTNFSIWYALRIYGSMVLLVFVIGGWWYGSIFESRIRFFFRFYFNVFFLNWIISKTVILTNKYYETFSEGNFLIYKFVLLFYSVKAIVNEILMKNYFR